MAEEKKEAKKPRVKMIAVNVIETMKEAVLVEFAEKGATCRVIVPSNELKEGKVAKASLDAGVPYGIPWEDLPQEMGCGSGMSCWRYLQTWQQAGVWDNVHKALLDRLRADEQIDLSAAVVDSSHVRAVGGARIPVPAL